jgi:hypothetical protein
MCPCVLQRSACSAAYHVLHQPVCLSKAALNKLLFLAHSACNCALRRLMASSRCCEPTCAL